MLNNKETILSIEDDIQFQNDLCSQLSDYYVVEKAGSLQAAKKLFSHRKYSVILLDKVLPDGCGFDLIPTLKSIYPESVIILLTSERSLSYVNRALELGADDYVDKPISIKLKKNEISHTFVEEIVLRIKKAKNTSSKLKTHEVLFEKVSSRSYDAELMGSSAYLLSLKQTITKIKEDTNFPVLISGPPSTGKKFISRLLSDSKSSFLSLNCLNLKASNCDDLLFGIENHNKTTVGLLEEGNSGTVVIEEVGFLPLKTQSKIATFIDRREYKKIGSDKLHHSNAKLICTTSSNIHHLVRKGIFSEDLYYKIKLNHIETVPMAQRPEDTLSLATYFLYKRFGANFKFSKKAANLISVHDWPGNIDELKFFVLNAGYKALLANRSEIKESDLNIIKHTSLALSMPKSIDDLSEKSLKNLINKLERAFLVKGLELTRGNVPLLQLKSGISKTNIYSKMKTFNLTSDAFTYD